MNLAAADMHALVDRWYAAWNAGELDAIMACYDDAIEHTSPFVARFNAGVSGGDPLDGTLRGAPAVRAYFARALETNPTPPGVTRFMRMHLAIGVSSIVLLYRRWTGELAGEIFFLRQGLIVRSVSHYG